MIIWTFCKCLLGRLTTLLIICDDFCQDLVAASSSQHGGARYQTRQNMFGHKENEKKVFDSGKFNELIQDVELEIFCLML